MWREIEVDAVKCDKCGITVDCTPENFNSSSEYTKILEILCPNCREPAWDWGILQQHSIAIKYRNQWLPSNTFLNNKNKAGIIKVRTKQDNITLLLLHNKANLENLGSHFNTPNFNESKIIWDNGKAVGYIFSNKFHGQPCLRQLFILKEYRKKGYGTALFNDFKNNNKKILVDAPNKDMCEFLLHIGLVKYSQDDGYETKDENKLLFVRPLR
jgi:GNAT superfamily N-acetyltransferase